LGVLLWCVALSVPLEARAVEYTPPTTPFTEPPIGTQEPEYRGTWTTQSCEAAYSGEVGGSNNAAGSSWATSQNTKEICRLVYQLGSQLNKRVFWLINETIKEREKLETAVAKIEVLHTDLGVTNVSLSTGGVLYQRLGDLLKALGTEGQLHKDLTVFGGVPVAGTVTVSNPTSMSGVEGAVLGSSETSNQNLWAALGMLVGFGLLGALYRVVRP
jgi:hypothetical protein